MRRGWDEKLCVDAHTADNYIREKRADLSGHGKRTFSHERNRQLLYISIKCINYLCYCGAEPSDDAAGAVGDAVVVYSERLVELLVRSTIFVPAPAFVEPPNGLMLERYLYLCSRNDPAMQQSMHTNRSSGFCHQYVIEDEVPKLRGY